MFARWSQENFFRYMRKHYNLDGLADYSTEEISDTTKLVNPEYRAIDGKVCSHVAKLLIDTIKMIAYRAETAMVSIIRDSMSRIEDARSLIEAIYTTEVDLIPDEEDGTLKVRLHQLANRSSGKTLQNLCNELNLTHTQFPGTNMQLIYELVS
jgi:hypothetical protein